MSSRRNAAGVRNRNNNMERNRNNRERSRERERQIDDDYWVNDPADENRNEDDYGTRMERAMQNVGSAIRDECYNRMKLKINVDMFLNKMPIVKRKIESMQCTICLNYFNDDQQKIELDCGHIYHFECIKNYLYEKCNYPLDPDSYELRAYNCPVCKKDFTRIIKIMDEKCIQVQLKQYKIKKEQEEEILCYCYAKEDGEIDEDEEEIKKLEQKLNELKNKKERNDAEKKLKFIENKEKTLEEETEKLKNERDRLKNLLEDFSELDLRPSQLSSADIIGDAYEYMIANFASDAGI